MDLKELEKEAIKASDKKCVKGCSKYYRYGFQDGYITGAEPREKRIKHLEESLLDVTEKSVKQIAELETQIKRLSKEVDDSENMKATLESKIAELEEISTRLESYYQNQKVRIAELEKEIEKMKNWCNCKNYQECLIELAEQGKGMNPSECCVNCKKWEIKEK